jgi:hypothetical protein
MRVQQPHAKAQLLGDDLDRKQQVGVVGVDDGNLVRSAGEIPVQVGAFLDRVTLRWRYELERESAINQCRQRVLV